MAPIVNTKFSLFSYITGEKQGEAMRQKITEAQLRAMKPTGKPQKISDGGGLYMHISAPGGMSWRYNFRYDGAQKTLTLGKYPEMGLREARDAHLEARRMLQNGINPAQHKQAAIKAGTLGQDVLTFGALANEWINKKERDNLLPKSLERYKGVLKLNILPTLGELPATNITAPILLEAANPLVLKGCTPQAHFLVQTCGMILRYGQSTGKALIDPTPALRGALPTHTKEHRATITDPAKVGVLLKSIYTDAGYGYLTQNALKLAPLTMLRPGEIVTGEWADIDFERAMWTIPAEKMKMYRPHIVPLSTQAVEILTTLKKVTGHGRYIFPGHSNSDGHMSARALIYALNFRNCTSEKITPHGFRGMASTLLNMKGYRSELIECQLAHRDRNAVRAAYNHADYLEERRVMLQDWADYLDTLRAGAK
jgi:integrase